MLFTVLPKLLIFFILVDQTGTFANSEDPDKTARRNEPSHQDLHGLPFSFFPFCRHPCLQQWTSPN